MKKLGEKVEKILNKVKHTYPIVMNTDSGPAGVYTWEPNPSHPATCRFQPVRQNIKRSNGLVLKKITGNK